MRVIPVIDLKQGVVVRGVAGQRSEYRPIQSPLAADARPQSVAQAFASGFGFKTVYVADLDAITLGRFDAALWQQIAASGMKLLLDAGIGNAAAAQQAIQQLDRAVIDADIIVGLESLESGDGLAQIARTCTPRNVIFSLDMNRGQPIVRHSAWLGKSPLEIVHTASAAGIEQMIVLDLADVGTGDGTRTLDLCRQIRQTTKIQTLIAGGGVRGFDDLQALVEAGCDAVLVASALHDGRLTPEDLQRAERLTNQSPTPMSPS